MEFKNNIFYKVCNELKEKSNNFKAKKIEYGVESTTYYYNFNEGLAIVATRLLELNLNNTIDLDVDIELDFADFESNRVHSPDEAFEILKDVEVDDLVSISFTKDLETRYFNDTFYFHQGQNEIECVSTFYDKEDPYSIYNDSYGSFD